MIEATFPPRAGHPPAAGRAAGAAPPADAPEAAAWDRFVAATPGGDLVQTAAWARAKLATGLDVEQVIVRRGGDIAGGALIVMKRVGLLGAVGYVARGPLLAEGAQDDLEHVLDEVERAARARRVRHLIVQPPLGAERTRTALAARGYTDDAPEVAPTATLAIDLSRCPEAILAGMSATGRASIRQSLRRGVHVRLGERADLDLFHAMHVASAQRKGFAPRSKAYLERHWEALHPSGALQLVFACHDGRALAAQWLTAFGDRVTARLTGWTGEAKHLQPAIASDWGAIRWAKEQGYRWYDLGGIDRRAAAAVAVTGELPEPFRRSHARYKTQFGGTPVLFPAAYHRTLNPLAHHVVRPALACFSRSSAGIALMNRLRNG